ncbi:LPP20 family lipoprotein [Kaarinaea lacus]
MLNTSLRWLFLSGYFLMLSGCAKDAIDPKLQALIDKPDWVLGESTKYQERLYLMGHGVSASLDKAKQQSIQDLADVYNVQLQVYINSEFSPSKTNQPVDTSSVTAAQKELYRNRISGYQQIAEIWQDPHSDAYHVLSVIDRVKAGKDLANDVYEINQKIQRAMDKAEQENDVLQRIAIAGVGIGKFQQRDSLQIAVNVLLPTAVVGASEWNDEKIQSRINSWLSEVKIMPVLNQNDPKLFDALVGGVGKAGFIVDYGANPDYILKASFQQGQIKWKDGVYALDGNLRLELWDGEAKGQVRGVTDWPIAVTAIEREQLADALANAVSNANEKKLRDALVGFEAD